jgi:hypothetical protein
MYKQTLQNVTYPDYPIQYPSSPSTGMEEIDADIWDSLLSIWIREKRLKKSFYHSLIPLLKIDWSSVLPDFEIRNETVLRIPEKKDISTRILEVTNKLMEVEETFKELDKKKVENFLRIIERNIPFEQLEILSDEELLTRVKKALGIELMCGLLNDLSEEQIMTFESTIKRRDLFK